MNKNVLLFLLWSCLGVFTVYAQDETEEADAYKNFEDEKEEEISLPEEMKNELVGAWQQFIYYERDGVEDFHACGIFQVVIEENTYRMYPAHQLKRPELINSRGIQKVKFDGAVWTFFSNWGVYGWGYFKLHKKDKDTYEGFAYGQDGHATKNRWKRVKV